MVRVASRSRRRAPAFVLLLSLIAAVLAAGSSGRPHASAATPEEQKVAVSLGGGENACVVTSDGEQWCWGLESDGGLGDGSGGYSTYEDTGRAVPVRSLLTGATQTSSSCAVTAGGQVLCWGATAIIEDGDGSLFSQPAWGSATPRAYGFSPASKVAGRCAVTLTGTVQCQGWNNWGQLGSGAASWPELGYPMTPPSTTNAVTVAGLSAVVDITANTGGYCAVKNDGTVWCWGLNSDGQLGNGESGTATVPCPRSGGCFDLRHSTTPVQVLGVTGAVAVHQSCAIVSGGTVRCWGANTGGRFQPAAPASQVYTGVEVPEFAGATDLMVTRTMACAVLGDTTVRCQGTGTLGDGSSATAPASVILPNVVGAVQVEQVSWDTYCVRFDDGRVACWGNNAQGQAGTGFRTEPPLKFLVPRYVIGFGGELPGDNIEVSVVVEPDEVELDMEPDGTPVPQTVTVKVTLRNTSIHDVEAITLAPHLALTVEVGDELHVTQTGGPTPPSIALLAADTSITVTYQLEVAGAGRFGVEATASWADPVTGATETDEGSASLRAEVDDGFEIELSGALTRTPAVIEVTAVIRNDGDHPIEDITWPDEELPIDVLVGEEPVIARSGPTPPLPTDLAVGTEQVVRWTMTVADAGAVVLGLQGEGSTPIGVASAFEEMSAQISAGLVNSIALLQASTLGLEGMLTDMSTTVGDLFETSTAQVATETSATEQLRQQEYESWRNLGFGDATARFLANGAVNRATFNNYISGIVDGGGEAIDRLGAEDGESLWRLVDTITDPAKRRAFAELMIDTARNEYGYLEDGFANPGQLGAVDLQVAYDSWRAAGTEAKSSVGFAVTGQADLWRIEAGEFAADPLTFATKAGKRHGGQGATVAYYTAAGVAEEAVTGGLGPVTRAGAVIEGGVDGLRNGRRAATAEGGIDAGSDAFGAAASEFADAERRAQRYQDLPYGSTVDMDQLEQLGGFSAGDAADIQSIIDDVKDLYGVDVEMAFRTAEPMSVGIDGVGKRAFTKEKAVGRMDLLLGAPEPLAGRVTIFEPKPLSADALRAAEVESPGFTALYEQRLAIQQKNWASFQAGNSRTQRIAAASEQYGGVTVVDAVPGHPTYGVEFLEQLDDAAYMATRPDLTPTQIAELRSHPSRTFTDLEIVEVDGAFTLVDNVRVRRPDGSVDIQPKPVISDYDGQSVRPTGGEWPAGVRGQVETYIKTRMDAIGRSGRHGWSDAANDLPSDLFHLAAEYVMSTTHPALAERVAADLSRRFGLLADEFAAKADRLESGLATITDDALRAKRQAEIDSLRGLAASYRTFTAEEILRKWPAGEKTIVFTTGRITVGSNGGAP